MSKPNHLSLVPKTKPKRIRITLELDHPLDVSSTMEEFILDCAMDWEYLDIPFRDITVFVEKI